MATVTLAEALSALRYTGAIKASVLDKGTEILTWLHKEHDNYTTHVWGYDPNVRNTEHHSGYALDIMTFTNKVMGDKIYAYLMDNAARLGLQHVLWQQTITSTIVQPGVRRQMGDRGNGTNNHMDHLHVLFLPTAYRAPSGPASPIPNLPNPAPVPTKPTYDRAKTAKLQGLLKVDSGRVLGQGHRRRGHADAHRCTGARRLPPQHPCRVP